MKQKLIVLLQHVIPHHGLSRLVLVFTRIRFRPFKNALTAAFMRGYRPDLSDALEPDPYAYEDFNAFYTRALRPDARPLAGGAETIVCPVDGAMNQCGPIEQGQLLQAKGHHYSLDALLAGAAPRWSPLFRDGSFATIYLAPFNYHRIHMPADGRLAAAWYVPGRLFSVNTTAARMVPGLFARNERVVLLFEGDFGPFAVIFVGALNVGSMATVWHGDVTPRQPRAVTELPLPREAERFRARGAEIGRFNMGSTVILLFGPGAVQLAAIDSGVPLRLGQAIATRIAGTTA
jgi:phosphatidylserine decarboxylase